MTKRQRRKVLEALRHKQELEWSREESERDIKRLLLPAAFAVLLAVVIAFTSCAWATPCRAWVVRPDGSECRLCEHLPDGSMYRECVGPALVLPLPPISP